MDADLGRVLLAVGDARAMRVGRQDRAAAQNAVMACVDAIADFDIRFFSVPGVFEPFRASNAACRCKSYFQGNLRKFTHVVRFRTPWAIFDPPPACRGRQ